MFWGNPVERLSKDFRSMKTETSRANAGFERINQLFALEREYAALIPEERYTQRQEHSKKVLDDFYAWLETVNPSQGTGLAKAVQYARNEKSYLYAFLEDPQIPIDNNLAERAVKPFVIGWKKKPATHKILCK